MGRTDRSDGSVPSGHGTVALSCASRCHSYPGICACTLAAGSLRTLCMPHCVAAGLRLLSVCAVACRTAPLLSSCCVRCVLLPSDSAEWAVSSATACTAAAKLGAAGCALLLLPAARAAGSGADLRWCACGATISVPPCSCWSMANWISSACGPLSSAVSCKDFNCACLCPSQALTSPECWVRAVEACGAGDEQVASGAVPRGVASGSAAGCRQPCAGTPPAPLDGASCGVRTPPSGCGPCGGTTAAGAAWTDRRAARLGEKVCSRSRPSRRLAGCAVGCLSQLCKAPAGLLCGCPGAGPTSPAPLLATGIAGAGRWLSCWCACCLRCTYAPFWPPAAELRAGSAGEPMGRSAGGTRAAALRRRRSSGESKKVEAGSVAAELPSADAGARLPSSGVSLPLPPAPPGSGCVAGQLLRAGAARCRARASADSDAATLWASAAWWPPLAGERAERAARRKRKGA